MSTVTQNDSAHPGSSVVCNGCEDKDSHAANRRWGLGGPHCRTCHSARHRACAVCGACLPDGHRWDRYYCSPTCRGRGKREREQAALERAVWEAEHPEEAARNQAEFDAWANGLRAMTDALFPPAKRERRARQAALKARADRCAECDTPFASGDMIFRRAEWGYAGAVLPYCGEHRCPQRDGYHNADAVDGYYPDCRCPGGYGDRKWLEPEPCASCGRLVRNDMQSANPWRFVRQWTYFGEQELVARTFCSDRCRQSFARAEREAKRASGDSTRRCESCSQQFTGRGGASLLLEPMPPERVSPSQARRRRRAVSRLVDAATVAETFGTSHGYVHDHADELSAYRLGTGQNAGRGRLGSPGRGAAAPAQRQRQRQAQGPRLRHRVPMGARVTAYPHVRRYISEFSPMADLGGTGAAGVTRLALEIPEDLVEILAERAAARFADRQLIDSAEALFDRAELRAYVAAGGARRP